MDWILFWTAFGAIGTSLGSLITAIAVVIAVRQYRQPLVKRLKISFTSAIPVGLGIDNDLFCISVSNTGVRPINVSNIYFNIGEKNLVLNLAQFSIPGLIPPLSFPVEIQPEQKVKMYLDRVNIAQYFAENIANGHFNEFTKIRIAVTDQTGGWHYHQTNCTVRTLAYS